MRHTLPTESGFTLIELMITIAVLAVIAAIAVPIYNGYIREAKLGAARSNADTLRLALEDWRLDNGTYEVGGSSDFNPKSTAALGWSPDGDQGAFTYAVVGASTTSYTIEVTHVTGVWLRCENRMDKCCDGTGSPTACP